MSTPSNKQTRKKIDTRTRHAHPTRLPRAKPGVATLPLRGRDKPAPPRDPRAFAPVFVLAPPRSYTSVIATMIGQHPDLAGLPELKLFAYRTVGELEASLPAYWIERGFTHRSPGLVRALAQVEFGDQTPASLGAARAWLRARPHWSGADVLDVLLRRLAPRVAVEKSPENVATAAALRRLASAYPHARYLHLTRHPVATQASLARHLLRTVPEHPRLGEPMAGIAAWHGVHARIVRFVATLPAGRFMRVRAEDVLNDPAPQLKAIADWLGLRADDAAIEAMRHPEASPFARFAPSESGVIGGHDHGFLGDPVPRRAEVPATVAPPPGWHGAARLWRRAAALARRLGYGEARTGPPRRHRHNGGAFDPGALRAELLRRRDLDAGARRAYAGAPAEMARLMEMDSANTAWLAAVVEQVGWPGHSLVGADGAHAAWLLAQHADLNRPFQQRCLELLRQAVERGEASAADLAHLTDRVLLAQGEAQLYGTQAPRPARSVCPGCRAPIEICPPAPGATSRFECPACGATGTVHARPRVAPLRL
jgi:hypothetical protein